MKPSFRTLKATARVKLQGHYGVLVSAYLLTILLPYILSSLFSLGYVPGNRSSLIIQYAASFIISILSTVLSVGMLSMILNRIRGKVMTLGQLFFAFRNHADKFILCALMFTIPTFPGMVLETELTSMIMSGVDLTSMVDSVSTIENNLAAQSSLLGITIAVTILGYLISLFLILHFIFVYQILLENPETPLGEALHEASELTKGNRGRLFLLYLSFIGWYLLGLLSMGIGMLWIAPYLQTTLTCYYLTLKGETPAQPEPHNFEAEA